MGHSAPTRIVLWVLVVAMGLGGCATALGRMSAPDARRLLAQAGFTVRQADTPARMAKLKTLPAYKVMPWTRPDGTVVYGYADPDGCKCVYVGNAQQYATYQQLVAAERMELDRETETGPMPSEWME